MIGNVYPFWRCFKVMPLVYDESLSYYEVLCKLTEKLNDVINQLSKIIQKFMNILINRINLR